MTYWLFGGNMTKMSETPHKDFFPFMPAERGTDKLIDRKAHIETDIHTDRPRVK